MQDELFSESTVKAPMLLGFSQKGRMGRLTFANAVLVVNLLLMVMAALLQTGGLLGSIIYLMLVLFFLRRAMMLRLHDMNVTGAVAIILAILWMAASPGTAMLAEFTAQQAGIEAISTVATLLAKHLTGIAILNTLVNAALLIVPGTKGVNRFGMQPKRGNPIGIVLLILLMLGGLALWMSGYVSP